MTERAINAWAAGSAREAWAMPPTSGGFLRKSFGSKARFTVGLAAVASMLLAACGAAASSAPGTAKVTRGNLVQTVSASGVVVSGTQAKLSFQVAGKIAKVDVAAGDTVKAGQVLAELDSSQLQAAVKQAEAARDAASAGVATAQAKAQQIQAGARPENVAQANAAVDIANQKLQDMLKGGRPEQVGQAQAQLDQAQAKLQALKNGPRPEQVAILQQQVETAKNALYGAQTSRDGACNPRNPDYLCSAANSQVAAAQSAVDTAIKQLQLATAPPTATDLQQAQAGVNQAQQALNLAKNPFTPAQIQQARDAVAQAQAQANLAARPFTDADLAAAQAGIQQAEGGLSQAEAALNAAKINLGFAQLKAPADGKVLQVNNSAGEAVSPVNVPIVLGIGHLLINVSLPEAAITRVQPGQPAQVTFDSLPGKVYQGKITDVPPAATTAQNLVTYVATAQLDRPDNAIRAGMSATVTIYTRKDGGVLLIPNEAVQSYQGKVIAVAVASNGQTNPVDIETGPSDQQNTEVLSGLTEGQTVQLIGTPLNGTRPTSTGASSAPSGPGPAPATNGSGKAPGGSK
ncbi:MAG: efflux RND transporter periplasmic adaptor subunit [Chloroflexota bacterium]|nr:efflux RND transporter periplasmic adaptor subunit [Chloroflexota bacterium]